MKKNFIILLVLTFAFAVDYETEIQPIFNNHCGNCHLGNSSGGLNLSNYENLMSSGSVVAGNHESSDLYDRITRPESAQGDMPPTGSLSQNQIDLIANWIDEGALPEESNDVAGCMDPNAINCDDEIDPLYFPECSSCSDGIACDSYYNPDATVDNGLCMYNDVPEDNEFSVAVQESGLLLDWSSFTPPVSVNQYVLMRCLDADGDTDGDGYLEYENCYFILNPAENYQNTQFLDEFDSQYAYDLNQTAGIKYTLSLYYPNNNYWGSAFGNYYFYPDQGACTDGEMNFDDPCMPMECIEGEWIDIVIDCAEQMGVPCEGGVYIPPAEGVCCSECELYGDLNFDGIVNVIDIVSMVNIITSSANIPNDLMLVSDLNFDGVVNVIDIVSLVNIIIS